MRKFLTLAAAVAFLALGSVNTAKAQSNVGEVGPRTASYGDVSVAVGYTMFAAWTIGMAAIVYNDIMAGGLNRKYAEVTPGAGFQSRDYATAAKLTHEFNVAMGYSDDADTAKYLASAAK